MKLIPRMIHLVLCGLLPFSCFLLSACSYTMLGRGFDLLEDNQRAEALSYFEQSAKEQSSREAAIMASFLYLSDVEIPRNLSKAREYYEYSVSLRDRDVDGQWTDYYESIVEAEILLFDVDRENDAEAVSILRGKRYSTYPTTLRLLAEAYAFGVGIEKDLGIARLLFERAIEFDNRPYSMMVYASMLVKHYDEEFRDPGLAMTWMEKVMKNKTAAEEAGTLSILASMYAANGYFDDATTTQSRALARLREDSLEYPVETDLLARYECHLKGYQQGFIWMYADNETPFSQDTADYVCELDDTDTSEDPESSAVVGSV